MARLDRIKATVIGGDGAIGTALTHALTGAGAHVAASSRRSIAREGRFYLDLSDDPADWVLPDADIVFLTGAMTRLAECRDDPARAHRINVEAPVELARRAAEAGGYSVFLSTNQVFDGETPSPRPDAPHSPRSLYGALKAEAEERLAMVGPQAAIVRLSKVVGPHLALFRGWIEALEGGGKINAFRDLVMAPIALDTVIDALLALAVLRQGGVWHVGGQTDWSYAEIGRWLAAQLGAPSSLVRESSAAEAGIPEAERPPHTVLDLGDAPYKLGVRPGPPETELARGLAALLNRKRKA